MTNYIHDAQFLSVISKTNVYLLIQYDNTCYFYNKPLYAYDAHYKVHGASETSENIDLYSAMTHNHIHI